MRININNKTDVPLFSVVKVYSEYCKRDDEETFYNGKEDIVLFKFKNIDYKMVVKYNLESISLTIEKIDIYAKEISRKGMRFLKLK